MAGPRSDLVVEQLYNAYTAPEFTTQEHRCLGTFSFAWKEARAGKAGEDRKNCAGQKSSSGICAMTGQTRSVLDVRCEQALAESASPRWIDGASARFAILETFPEPKWDGALPILRVRSSRSLTAGSSTGKRTKERERERQRTRMNRQDATSFLPLVLYPDSSRR